MAGVEFFVMIGCGGLLMLMSQLGEALGGYMQLFRNVAVVQAETEWDRRWRREANRQRREQQWREMWRQSDEEDFDNYADFLGEFEELTWTVEELFEENCEGWSVIIEEFRNILNFELEEEEIWDI